jgi:amidase
MAALDGLDLVPGEAELMQKAIAAIVESASKAEEVPVDTAIETKYPRRTPGYTPSPEEDPFNVFIRRCHVEGASEGPLAGMNVGVKDNMLVAGVPMSNASRWPAYTPTLDAVVVERVLEAGGTLVGKLNMDDYAGGGTGVTSVYGAARNPVNPTRSAGGSSGGSGAAVRCGAVDVALAVDQGGSGRIPAAFCGVVGVKATHGLVPTFGVTHIDHTLDYVTPLARTVQDAAVVLEAIAGADWRDPQWVRGEIVTRPYTAAKDEGVEGLRIGLVEESVSAGQCEPAVEEGVERAIASLAADGATVERVSLPIWKHGFTIFQPYVAHLVANMIRSEGEGYGHLGYIDVRGMHSFALARRAQAADLSPLLKVWMLADRYLHERYMNTTYGKLQNLRLAVRRMISQALEEYDLLISPTIPFTAPPLLQGPQSVEALLNDTPASIAFNTAILNLSGHPAITVPSGTDADGLPTAVQIAARHFDEYTGFRAAFSLEEAWGPFCEHVPAPDGGD